MFKIYKISDFKPELDSVINVKPIYGSELKAIDYYNYISKSYSATGKILTPSELGCTLTHIKIYNDIIDSNLPGLILESDVSISEELIVKVKETVFQEKIEFIHLGWHPDIEKGIFFRGRYEKSLGVYEVEPSINFHGTFSYYITPSCASALLQFHSDILKRADEWSVFFSQCAIKPYFFPIFTHPFERGVLQKERMTLSSQVFSLRLSNILFYSRKIVRRQFARLHFYNTITKERLLKDANK